MSFLLQLFVLYPPYLASIAITILATNVVLVPLFHIPHMAVSGRDLLLHLGYLNDIAGARWVNVVYWTLAIEFQWYLLVGLAMPLLAGGKVLRFAGAAAMTALFFAFPYNDRLVFHYLPVFLIGVFVFQYRAQLIPLHQMLGLIALMCIAMQHNLGWLFVIVSVATGLLIAFATFHNHAMDRIGDISM